ncbi:MAG: SGNH/GDSL hydrolase family protein [Chitinophagaceae bacterium]
MELEKIKILSFHLLSPLLLLFGGVILTSACTKKNTMTTAGNGTQIYNNTMPDTGTKKYLALGDSYTIGTSVSETERYPVQIVALLKAEGINMAYPEIIATNGWTTGDLVYATKDRPVTTSYDAVSLLIGVNNQYQGRSLSMYKQEFTALVQRSIQLADGKPDHVFVLSIPDYSVTPFASGSDRQKIAAEIDDFNEANKMIAADFKVHYLNITEASRKAAVDLSLVATDGLHFSGKEYAVWALQLAPMIKAVLQ